MTSSRKDFTPHPYQQLIREHLHALPRCAAWAGMGMGKTVSTLTALEDLSMVEDVYPALIAAPLRVARTTWPEEARKWSHLTNVNVMPIVGGVDERRLALRHDANVFTVNYENIPWLVEHFGERWPFKTFVADEATRLKSFRLGGYKKDGTPKGTAGGGVRAKALGRVAHTKIKRFIQLTGTPAPNSLIDLWGQLWFLDAGQRLGRTFSAFEQRWFAYVRDPNADPDQRYAVSQKLLPFAEQEIHDRLRDLCLTVDAKDWFDLDEPIVRNVYVDLPAAVRVKYREMEKEMFTQLEEHDIEAFNAAARTMKCLQFANGAVYTDDKGNWKEVHDEKIQALESVVAEANGAPVLVAYHFKSDLARLQRAFPKGRQLDADPATIRDWNAGKVPILFAHPASAGHGLNLQDGGNILVYFSVNWNLEEHQQILERIGPMRQKQAGHDRNVWVYRILARDTVDEVVLDRIESKREVQEVLLEAMKRRGYA
jgi:SNF2 family DNA or RNA helicase